MQTTLERPLVAAPAAPLNPAEADSLLMLAVSSEKVAKVPAGTARRESRAWSFGGNVD